MLVVAAFFVKFLDAAHVEGPSGNRYVVGPMYGLLDTLRQRGALITSGSAQLPSAQSFSLTEVSFPEIGPG